MRTRWMLIGAGTAIFIAGVAHNSDGACVMGFVLIVAGLLSS